MTSSNGNIFRFTGPVCGEFTGHRWIPLTKASDVELWCCLWSALWIKGWVKNRDPRHIFSKHFHINCWLVFAQCRHMPLDILVIIGSSNGMVLTCGPAITRTNADLPTTGSSGVKFDKIWIGDTNIFNWTNTGVILIKPYGTDFNEIWIKKKHKQFLHKKIYIKMLPAKWQPLWSWPNCV